MAIYYCKESEYMRFAIFGTDRDFAMRIMDSIKYRISFVDHFSYNCFTSYVELEKAILWHYYDYVIFLEVQRISVKELSTIQIMSPKSKFIFVSRTLSGQRRPGDISIQLCVASSEKILVDDLAGIVEFDYFSSPKVDFSFVEGKQQLLENEIIYLESKDHVVFFHLYGSPNQELHLYATLSSVQNKLSTQNFKRIHQSLLININHILNVDTHWITMKNNDRLPISRSHQKVVKELLTYEY